MHTRNLADLNEWIESLWVDQVLQARRLTTHYQPIVSNDGQCSVFGYECLLRGINEDGSIIPPQRLFGAARKAGTLAELDHAGRITAINAIAKRRFDGSYFINCCPRHFVGNDQRIEQTINAVRSAGLAPHRIVFEVVESEQIDDLETLMDIRDAFRNAGFQLALDDVGSGYNSLNRLVEVQPDFVKVDMKLIRGVHQDRFKSCVTQKLLELSREVGVRTIAEGIETLDEWNWACDNGADMGQGFYFARPGPDLAEVLLESVHS